MRYEHSAVFVKNTNPNEYQGRTYAANITQMSPDQAIPIFGDAKLRSYIVRIGESLPVTSGYIQVDGELNLEISQVIQHRHSTAIYCLKYVGRL